MSKIICFVVSLAMSLGSVQAGEDDSPPHPVRLDFGALLDECFKTFGITNAEYRLTVVKGNMSKIDPCFFGCYYKKVGLLNDKGQYNSTTYLTNLKDYYLNRNDSIYAMMKEGTEQCEYVKDKTVSDGEAGCEIGAMFAVCILEYEKQFFLKNYAGPPLKV